MKISIITVCYNSVNTIENTILSVLNQTYENIEYIIIDAKSNDGTINIIHKYKKRISFFISEKDNGMYDAINKGITISTGEIVGILNSDDIYSNYSIIETIAEKFILNNNLDAIIGNIEFITHNRKILRHYSSKNWNTKKFKFGYMPPHPSFFCKRSIYFKLGLYRTDFKIAADFELMLRYFLINRINYTYVNRTIVSMRIGGLSTKGLSSLYTINKEIKLACEYNNIYTNYLFIYFKYLKKIFEFKIFKF